MTTATPATPQVPAGTGRGGKHQQVRRRLDEVMAQLGVGEPLPAERDLAADFGVARMTLRRVVDALVEEGRLIRRQGAGTFVSPRRLDQRLSATSFSDDMRSRGLRPGARTLWARQVPAGMLLASVLGVDIVDLFAKSASGPLSGLTPGRKPARKAVRGKRAT